MLIAEFSRVFEISSAKDGQEERGRNEGGRGHVSCCLVQWYCSKRPCPGGPLPPKERSINLFSLPVANSPQAAPLPFRKSNRAIPEPVIHTEPQKEEANHASEEEESSQFVPVPAAIQPEKKTKKRKRQPRDEDSQVDDIESRYLKKVNSKLAKAKHQEQQQQLEAIPEQPQASIKAKNKEIDLDVNGPSSEEEPNDIAASETEEEEDPLSFIHESSVPEPSAEDRTIFLSNLPIKVLHSKPLLRSLKSLLQQFGPLSSLRFRSIAFSAATPRRVSFIHKAFHPERDSANAYAVYNTPEGVGRAVEALNGSVWEGKHLRVDNVGNPGVKDHKRCVFVGNLPFDVQDEDVWSTFERCGEIEFVRIVRDKKTNIGKGFGYVQFKVPSIHAHVCPRPLTYDRTVIQWIRLCY